MKSSLFGLGLSSDIDADADNDFDDADVDSNGSIDFAEFLKHEWEGRPELNYRNSNLRLIRRQFRKIDTNRDGKISRAEFVAMIEKCLDEEY